MFPSWGDEVCIKPGKDGRAPISLHTKLVLWVQPRKTFVGHSADYFSVSQQQEKALQVSWLKAPLSLGPLASHSNPGSEGKSWLLPARQTWKPRKLYASAKHTPEARPGHAVRHSPRGSHCSQHCQVTERLPQILWIMPGAPTASWVSPYPKSQTDSRRAAWVEIRSDMAISQGHPEPGPLHFRVRTDLAITAGRGQISPSEVQTSLLGALETSRLEGYLPGVGRGTKEPQGQEGQKERELVTEEPEREATSSPHPDSWTLRMEGLSIAHHWCRGRNSGLQSHLPCTSQLVPGRPWMSCSVSR